MRIENGEWRMEKFWDKSAFAAKASAGQAREMGKVSVKIVDSSCYLVMALAESYLPGTLEICRD